MKEREYLTLEPNSSVLKRMAILLNPRDVLCGSVWKFMIKCVFSEEVAYQPTYLLMKYLIYQCNGNNTSTGSKYQY